MTELAVSPVALKASLQNVLGDDCNVSVDRGEVTLVVASAQYLSTMQVLKEHAALRFEQLVDLCGVDYQEHASMGGGSGRFAAVSHLLSVSLNQRLRVRVFASDDDFPRVDSVTALWAAASWYEREAFDLYGIVFDGHDDLRRILTDYGFIGHPFRKDFPLSGHVEMRYDADRQRVVYEPVSIEPREITPRIVREDNYGGLH
jgi:NADH-quinone oxidoreductase subunit C